MFVIEVNTNLGDCTERFFFVWIFIYAIVIGNDCGEGGGEMEVEVRTSNSMLSLMGVQNIVYLYKTWQYASSENDSKTGKWPVDDSGAGAFSQY